EDHRGRECDSERFRQKSPRPAPTLGRSHVRTYPRRARRALPLMAVFDKIKRALRGEVELSTAAREAWPRGFASLDRRKDRAKIENYQKKPADVWQRLPAED